MPGWSTAIPSTLRCSEEPKNRVRTRLPESPSLEAFPIGQASIPFIFYYLFFPKRGCWCACRPPNNRGAGSSEQPARHPSAGLIAPSTARGLLAARSPDRERQARGSRVLRRPRAISQDRLWICLAPRGKRSDAVSFFDPPPLETFAAQIRSPHFFFFLLSWQRVCATRIFVLGLDEQAADEAKAVYTAARARTGADCSPTAEMALLFCSRRDGAKLLWAGCMRGCLRDRHARRRPSGGAR